MIYHISLQMAGLISGVFLLLVGLLGVIIPGPTRGLAAKFPRSRVAGFALLTLALVWCFWLLATMEMGEFSNFRKPLMFILPVGFFLTLWFVDEFLSVRALGILFLLAAEPLLDAAFLRQESSRLLVTALAYLLIVKGLVWVTMPYLLRDGVDWSARHATRWIALHSATAAYGAILIFFALTRY